MRFYILHITYTTSEIAGIHVKIVTSAFYLDIVYSGVIAKYVYIIQYISIYLYIHLSAEASRTSVN